MKTHSLFLVLLVAFAFAAPLPAAPPDVVDAALIKALAPIGFDDNDRVQVLVQGQFSSTCYKVDSYSVEKDESAKVVRIRQKALHYGGPCLRMIVPFAQVIDVGLIHDGEYRLIDATTGQKLGALAISRSTGPGPDDFLYAPISDAYVDSDSAGKSRLWLRGNFPTRCLRLKEVKMNFYSEVIVVQPIAESLVSPNVPCAFQPMRFLHSVALPQSVKGTYLVHIRSMEGQAVNKLLDIP